MWSDVLGISSFFSRINVKNKERHCMFPQITVFYDLSAFINTKVQMKTVPQVALETFNPPSLRASLWSYCFTARTELLHSLPFAPDLWVCLR